MLLAGLPPLTIAVLVAILAASALMSGLSGFGFSAIGALCLIFLPPKLGVPLLMTLSAANQVMSLRQLKADMAPIKHWWPDGPAPYLLGGLIGVPVGLAILSSLPTADLMLVFGGFLVIYAGSEGYVDDIPVADVQRYEAEVRAHFRASHADILDGIRTSGKLPEGDVLADALRKFTDTFDTGKVD